MSQAANNPHFSMDEFLAAYQQVAETIDAVGDIRPNQGHNFQEAACWVRDGVAEHMEEQQKATLTGTEIVALFDSMLSDAQQNPRASARHERDISVAINLFNNTLGLQDAYIAHKKAQSNSK